MNRFFQSTVLLSAISMALLGCAEKSATKSQTEVTTPGGTTTTTVEKTVEKSGENPPPAR